MMISYFLPSLIRMREWRLLFDINRDGVSMQTFFNKTKDRDNTVILVQDEQDWVFGAYCCEAWRMSSHFFGRGENFVFTFEKGEDIRVWRWQGGNEQFQFSDEDCLMIGGSLSKAGSALYLAKYFSQGQSCRC